MGSEMRRSLGARLYALLLYLYPASFRREYGEAMLQLFNDQCRSVKGPGGHAMLWLKTLRDLLRSVPAAHSNEPRPRPTGAQGLWAAVVIIGLVFLLNALILPQMISRLPSDGVAAIVENPTPGPSGEHRVVAEAVAGLVSTLLAGAALVFAVRRRSLSAGAGAFIAGGALTFMVLAMNPWLWMPFDRYPTAMAWAIGVWPLAAVAWVVLRVVAWRRGASVG
jgi:hypothetical protein